jgi:hypothetical protein
MKPRPQFKAPDYRSAGKLKACVALITGGDSALSWRALLNRCHHRPCRDLFLGNFPRRMGPQENVSDWRGLSLAGTNTGICPTASQYRRMQVLSYVVCRLPITMRFLLVTPDQHLQ